MTENSNNWDQELTFPDTGDELEKIQKQIRHRNHRLVLTSVILAIAILLCSVTFVIPAAEKLYWDPTVCSYLDDVTDLELTMATYNNLFGHGQHIMPPTITKYGFADYSIETMFVEWETINRMTMLSKRSATLTDGTFDADPSFWLDMMEGSFIRQFSEDDLLISHTNEKSKETLTALPEYIQVLASVTFSKDLSMKQLMMFMDEFSKSEARVLWAILRTSDPSEHVYPCGIQLTDYVSERYHPDYWKDTSYPNLFPERWTWTPKSMEEHVLSTLQFSADQFIKGTGLVPQGETEEYYENTLRYLEENGIKTYGCYILTTPDVLLKMMENGTVSYVFLVDARIGLE